MALAAPESVTSYWGVGGYIKKTQAVENDCLRFGW